MKTLTITLVPILLAAFLAGCGPKEEAAATIMAVANLQPTEGNAAAGKVTFTTVDEGVRVVAEVEGLTPGDHGFHVHQNGDCSAPDATSAGGHFNPESHDHGPREADVRHVGDLGNLTAGEDGKARVEFIDTGIVLEGEHSIVGRAVIVHAQPDDFSQPTGNAGARVACGVIEQLGTATE